MIATPLHSQAQRYRLTFTHSPTMERKSHLRRTPPRPIFTPSLAQYLASMSIPGLGPRRTSGKGNGAGHSEGTGSASAASSGISTSTARCESPYPSNHSSPLHTPAHPHLHLPGGLSSVSLSRNASTSSQRSQNGSERRGRGLIPSPRAAPSGLPSANGTASAASSASGSRSGSFIATHAPKILSRRGSHRENKSGGLLRSASGKAKKDKEDKEKEEEPPLPTRDTAGSGLNASESQEV